MKTFTFRLGNSSFKKMSERLKRAATTETPDVHEDEMTCNSVESMVAVMTKSRLEAFAAIIKQKPKTLKELAQYLGKDLGNVSRDVKALELLGIIVLKENKNDARELRPVTKYDQITFDFTPARKSSSGN